MDRTFGILAIFTIGCILVAALFFAEPGPSAGQTDGPTDRAGPLERLSLERFASDSLVSTGSFSLTIIPNHTLYEVTMLLPLPADAGGFSPVVTEAGARNASGLPGHWNTTLIGTREFTYLGISVDVIAAPQGVATPYNLTITTTTPRVALDTTLPGRRDPLFRPRTAEMAVACPPAAGGTPRTCTAYTIPVFAEYRAVPDAQVEIRLEFTGSNGWQYLGEHSGGYRDTVALSLHGTVLPRWHRAIGILASGIGEEFP